MKQFMLVQYSQRIERRCAAPAVDGDGDSDFPQVFSQSASFRGHATSQLRADGHYLPRHKAWKTWNAREAPHSYDSGTKQEQTGCG